MTIAIKTYGSVNYITFMLLGVRIRSVCLACISTTSEPTRVD